MLEQWTAALDGSMAGSLKGAGGIDGVVSILGRLVCPGAMVPTLSVCLLESPVQCLPSATRHACSTPPVSCLVGSSDSKWPNLDPAFQTLNVLLLQGLLLRKCHLLPQVAQFRNLDVHPASAVFRCPLTRVGVSRVSSPANPTGALRSPPLGLHPSCLDHGTGLTAPPSFLPFSQSVLYTVAREVFSALS